ncbi:hypothetical protein AX15_001596 [Amanita polypyramis BW_CC]|nr:hypothetical protein AX15_001596 [Amanita polypyramis BW_CC]
MSDKPLVQQALANELAELLLGTTSTIASFAFLRGFWESIVREWNGIDRLRIDKYYMLVRRFVNATFRLLIRADWDGSLCDDCNKILTEQGGPLCPSDMRVPTSLSYHLADIYLEELEKALSSSLSAPPAPLYNLLKPFFSLAAKTQNKTTYQRCQSALFVPLFSALSDKSHFDGERPSKRTRVCESEFPTMISNACFEKPKSEGCMEPAELKKLLLGALSEIASLPDTRDSNRRRLLALCKEAEAT